MSALSRLESGSASRGCGGDRPVEWIALYGVQGERRHIRVRPTTG